MSGLLSLSELAVCSLISFQYKQSFRGPCQQIPSALPLLDSNLFPASHVFMYLPYNALNTHTLTEYKYKEINIVNPASTVKYKEVTFQLKTTPHLSWQFTATKDNKMCSFLTPRLCPKQAHASQTPACARFNHTIINHTLWNTEAHKHFLLQIFHYTLCTYHLHFDR